MREVWDVVVVVVGATVHDFRRLHDLTGSALVPAVRLRHIGVLTPSICFMLLDSCR